MEGNLPFLPRFTCVFEGNFQVQAPRGPYISRGDLGADHLRGEGGWVILKKISCKRLSEEKNCMQHKCNKELKGKKREKNILPTILLEKKILDDQKSPTPTLKS